MLDEECLRPGNVSDLTFLDKLDHFCCSHRHYQSRGCAKSRSDRTLPHDAFRLIHYAGAVSMVVGEVYQEVAVVLRIPVLGTQKC